MYVKKCDAIYGEKRRYIHYKIVSNMERYMNKKEDHQVDKENTETLLKDSL